MAQQRVVEAISLLLSFDHLRSAPQAAKVGIASATTLRRRATRSDIEDPPSKNRATSGLDGCSEELGS
jgi:hypothetical protein